LIFFFTKSKFKDIIITEGGYYMNDVLLSLLKNARQAKGLKQNDVALKLGLKGNTISNWEKGRSEPDIETFIKLCSIYEINATELLEKAYRNLSDSSEFTVQEQKHIKKYRALDERGKKTVDNLLNYEYNLQAYNLEGKTIETGDEEIDEELRNYHLELVAEKRGRKSDEISKKKEQDV